MTIKIPEWVMPAFGLALFGAAIDDVFHLSWHAAFGLPLVYLACKYWVSQVKEEKEREDNFWWGNKK